MYVRNPHADVYCILRPAPQTAILPASVRWCNGSTRPFGGFCHGSNPCRTANRKNSKIQTPGTSEAPNPKHRSLTFTFHASRITHDISTLEQSNVVTW